MKHYNSIIIGHITDDLNTDYTGQTIHSCGGAVLFSSASAYSLGHRVAAITKLSKNDADRLNAFTIDDDDVYCSFCNGSVVMENVYFTKDRDKRKSKCKEFSEQFTIDDIPEDIDADVYHFAGLLYGDFSDDLIKSVALNRGAVALDVQACLRHANKETGEMYFEDWSTKKEMLKYISFLKTDAAEAEILTGTKDRYEAAKILYSWGAKEILITHSSEVLVYDGKSVYTCPIKARDLIGRTGRGDTTFAAYINERINNNIEDSLLTATATVSLKMETPGPLKCNREDVLDYIKEFY